jgi:tetratricopeptide (TPR) repeat protein
MPDTLWSRIRKGRVAQIVAVYLGVSWLMLQIVGELRDALELPVWIGPTALILLVVGLVVVLATAWVQSHPLVDRREAADEVPESWELDLPGIKEAVSSGSLPHLTWSRAAVGGVFAFSLLFGIAGAYVLLTNDGGGLAPATAIADAPGEGIAVLPFTVRGEDVEEWREGMIDLLSTGLDGAGGMRAIDSRTVLARWSELIEDGSVADEATTIEVARRTGARYALLGSAVSAGPQLRLTAEVHDLEGAGRLAEVQVTGSPEDVFSLVDDLAMQTLAAIAPDRENMRVDLASRTTTSLEALKAYLDGEVLHRGGQFREASAAYERAVAADSMFALAWYGLSNSRGWEGGVGTARGREASARAYALQDRLPDREAILVRAVQELGLFRPDGLQDLQRGLRLYPDDPEMWYQLGETYLHVPETLASWDDVLGAYSRAIELAPQFGPYRIHMIEYALRVQGDSALAAGELEAFDAVSPASARSEDWRLAIDLVLGDPANSAAAMARISEMPRQTMGRVNNYLGHPRFWETRRQILQTLEESGTPAQAAFPWRLIAQLQVENRGHLQSALDRLEGGAQPRQATQLRYRFRVQGFPIPEDVFDAALTVDTLQAAGSGHAYFIGAAAADRADWRLHAAAIERQLSIAGELEAEGNSVAAERDRARARVLEGYRLWKEGDPEAALPILEEAHLHANSANVRWWLFQLHREAGRFAEAERYLQREMMWDPNPFAAYHLGQLYEEMDDPLKAREMYELFVGNWTDPDPELQPWVDDATERLLRLSDFQQPDG